MVTYFASSALQLLKTLWLDLKLRKSMRSMVVSRGLLSASAFPTLFKKCHRWGLLGFSRSPGPGPVCCSQWLSCQVACSLPSPLLPLHPWPQCKILWHQDLPNATSMRSDG